MSESTTVLVQTETVGATVIVTGATVIGTVPIGPQGPAGDTGPAGADGADGAAGPQGDPGEGVPVGGTAGQVLTKDSGTDFDTSWQDAAGGGGGVTDADFLVGTAHAGLSGEIVVGTSPGGELGGTWASPTVDATHSGSSHAGVQAAAEATAAAALSAHEADTTSVHGIADTSALETTSGAQAKADAKVTQTITNGVTTTAPSEDAVFDALANKQPLDADLTALAAAGNSAVLAATTASFLTTDETKLDGIEAGAQVNPTTEVLQDLVGAMVSGGTETGIAVSYDDTNARLDFVAEVTQAELDAVAAAAEVLVEDPNDPGEYVKAPLYIGETDPAVGGEDPYVWLDPADLGAPADYLSTSAAASTYVPQAGDRVLLTADKFIVSAGSPVLSLSASRFAAYVMDSTTLEQVNASFWLPDHWATFDVDLWWSNAGAGSGNAVWSSARSIRGDGEDLSAGDTYAGLGTIAAPAQDILKISAGVLTGIANDAAKFHHIRIIRAGDDGADTLTTDAFFLGLMLRRAS